jgi:hypothetical protein
VSQGRLLSFKCEFPVEKPLDAGCLPDEFVFKAEGSMIDEMLEGFGAL